MSGHDIESRLASVRERVANAASRVGRKPEEITLLGVAKRKPPGLIVAAARKPKAPALLTAAASSGVATQPIPVWMIG